MTIRSTRSLRLFALCAALPAFACGCGDDALVRPTIVVVSLDTTRADHLSTYGYERETDPFLRSFAARSRVFEVGVPAATWTLPSHVSLFSGLDPSEHGCWMHLEDVDSDESGGGYFPSVGRDTALVTTPVKSAGYHLIAAVGGPFTSERYGLLRDFDEHVDPGQEWELSAAQINSWLKGALERRPKNRPLFLFVNYFDAHAPYAAPTDRTYPFPADGRELTAVPPLEQRSPEDGPVPPALLRDAVDQYDRELLVQDTALGELFAWLERDGLMEDALVVITGDHGEMFGEQSGMFGHGCLPFEPVARVPLVVHRTGGPKDRVSAPVSLTNVPTTILGTLGLPYLSPGGGGRRVDLLALPDLLPTPYVEHRSRSQWIGVMRGERFKYGALIYAEERKPSGADALLIDLVADPSETRGASPGGAADADADADAEVLRAELRHLARSWLPEPEDLPPAAINAEELERLRALGYGGGK